MVNVPLGLSSLPNRIGRSFENALLLLAREVQQPLFGIPNYYPQ